MIIKFIERIITFSETLGPNDLALWLLQEVGNDYGDDIEKLKGIYQLYYILCIPQITTRPFSNAIANRINGKLFLELEDGSIMSDLSLTYGFKRLVYGLLEKV